MRARSPNAFAWTVAVAVVLVALLASHAGAQAPAAPAVPPPEFDVVVATARDAMRDWMATLLPYALGVFMTFAVGELTLLFGRTMIAGELEGSASMFILFAIRKGLWLFLLLGAGTILPAIVFSLQKLGTLAAQSALSPVFGGSTEPQALVTGVWELAKAQWQGHANDPLLAKLLPTRAFELLFAVGTIAVAYWLVAAFAWVAIIRAYITMTGGQLMLLGGGSTATEGFAMGALRYAVGAGLNLFVIELLKGLFFGYLKLWIDWAKVDTMFGIETAMQILQGAFAVIVCLISVPGFVAGMATGAQSHAGEALTLAAAAKALSSVAGAVHAAAPKTLAFLSDLSSRLGAQSSGGEAQPSSSLAVAGGGGSSWVSTQWDSGDGESAGRLSANEGPPRIGRGGESSGGGPRSPSSGGGGAPRTGGSGSGGAGGNGRSGTNGSASRPPFRPDLGRGSAGHGRSAPRLLTAGSPRDDFDRLYADEDDVEELEDDERDDIEDAEFEEVDTQDHHVEFEGGRA